jgi:hypothetical protein
MKLLLSCLLVFITLSSQQCNNDLDITALYQRWTHLHENDAEGVKEYRNNNYDFPLSRGRTGFEFKKDGSFIQYDIAPTDGNIAVNGSWKPVDGKKEILIQLKNEENSTYRLLIVELTKDMLKVKKITN